jgi:hypothetical protein
MLLKNIKIKLFLETGMAYATFNSRLTRSRAYTVKRLSDLTV